MIVILIWSYFLDPFSYHSPTFYIVKTNTSPAPLQPYGLQGMQYVIVVYD